MEKSFSKDLQPIGRVISSSFESGFLGLAKELVKVFQVWPEAAGSYIDKRSRPHSIKDGCLIVMVESAVWIDRFGYLKQEIIQRLNQALGDEIVDDVVFRVGSISGSDSKKSVT